MSDYNRVNYKLIEQPKLDCTNKPVLLSDETMEERYNKVMNRMKIEGIDSLVIYADLEHGGNFEYLTGFLPRFEEALLVLNQCGDHYMLMGNENLNKVAAARICATAIHVPHFSLPNQPMDVNEPLIELIKKAKIQSNSCVGIVGWKNFTSKIEDNQQIFDVPSYIVEAIKKIVDGGSVFNATFIFIGDKGVRCVNNVNEIEHYEFGAALASDSILRAMNMIELGVSEMEMGEILNSFGQRNSVVTIASAGPRFIKANIYPTNKRIELNDSISLTVGYKGGLSSRAGYAVHSSDELGNKSDYLDVLVKPYYNAIACWLESVCCGLIGDKVYQLIESVLPKSKFNWSLCPGHLVADEEWMSSPIYSGSEEVLESGMLFQIDIIPSQKGYAGTSCESTVLIADKSLREKIKQESPELWDRIKERREYIKNVLGININEDILPMCSTVGYLRPLLLDKNKAMCL